MNYDDAQLKINTQSHRLELDIDGNIAFIEHRFIGDRLILIHTEVPPELEGKGVGTAIVTKALQFAKDNNYKIVPICPFVNAYLKRHKEWNDIIAPDSERFLGQH